MEKILCEKCKFKLFPRDKSGAKMTWYLCQKWIMMDFFCQLAWNQKWMTYVRTQKWIRWFFSQAWFLIKGREYLMSFYLKVRLLVLLLSYGVHWKSPGQHTLYVFGPEPTKNCVQNMIKFIMFDDLWLRSTTWKAQISCCCALREKLRFQCKEVKITGPRWCSG